MWLVAIVMLMTLIGVWICYARPQQRIHERRAVNRIYTLSIAHEPALLPVSPPPPTLAPLVRQTPAGAYSSDGLHVYTVDAVNGVTCHAVGNPALREVIRGLAGATPPNLAEVWEMLGHPELAARERDLQRAAVAAPCPVHWVQGEHGERIRMPMFGCAACSQETP